MGFDSYKRPSVIHQTIVVVILIVDLISAQSQTPDRGLEGQVKEKQDPYYDLMERVRGNVNPHRYVDSRLGASHSPSPYSVRPGVKNSSPTKRRYNKRKNRLPRSGSLPGSPTTWSYTFLGPRDSVVHLLLVNSWSTSVNSLVTRSLSEGNTIR